MEINWSTFVLELLNFAVLIWLLNRFLYKPVRGVVEARQAEIAERERSADETEAQAQQRVKEYEGRLVAWREEQNRARAQLNQELSERRIEAQRACQSEIEDQRKRAEIVQQRQLKEWQQHCEKSAVQQGAEFASHILRECAGPEVERRLIGLFLESLAEVSEQKRAQMLDQYGEISEARVFTAFELSEADSQRLVSTLSDLLGREVRLSAVHDPSLIAGIRVIIGSCDFEANLKAELQAFVESAL